MKKIYMLFATVVFTSVMIAQVELTLNDYTQNNNEAYEPLIKGTSEKASDVFYIQGTPSNNTSNLVCDFGGDVTKRVQGNGIIINVKSVTTLEALQFHSNSSGSASRGVLSIETSAAVDGTYTPVTGYVHDHLPLNAGSNAETCGTITVTGLNINTTATPFVKILFTTVENSGEYQTTVANIRFFIVTLNPILTSVNAPTINDASVLTVEYFNVIGVKVGSEWNMLPAGVYIVKTTYNDGSVATEKVSKTKR
jgi:hypothetical protein